MPKINGLTIGAVILGTGIALAQTPSPSGEVKEPWSQYQKDQKATRNKSATPAPKPQTSGQLDATQPATSIKSPRPTPSPSPEQPWNKYEKDAKKSPSPAPSSR